MRYLLMLPLAMVAACGSATPECAPGTYTSAAGDIWNGVTIYYGPDHARLGRVVETASRHQFPNGNVERAVRIVDDFGADYWMRRAVLLDPSYQVRCDDPAIPH